MTNKLYVANLSPDTTEDELRAHFATCGGVLDVELLLDRRTNASRGLARVTMTTSAFAANALSRLNSAQLRGKTLVVSETREPATPTAKVKIAQQFRERDNMAYDLDCEGAPLTIRIYPMPDGSWRIEARATDAAEAVVISSCGTNRSDVLVDVVRAWNREASGPSSPLRRLDDAAVMQAMRDVRAV